MSDGNNIASNGRRRRLRKPNPERLRRRALAYLQRFSTSRSHLRDVMLRRATPEAEHHEVAINDLKAWIDALLDDLQRLGLLDDQSFADARARRLLTKGKPLRLIRSALSTKGLAADVIDRAIENLAESHGNPEWQAAIAFARRRRLGPFRTTPSDHQKELAILARAGFGFSVSERLLSMTDADELQLNEY